MKTKILCTAQWCSPCKTIKSELARKGVVWEAKDADEDKEFFAENNIKSVPTLLIFENGLLLKRVVGSMEIMKEIK